VSFVPPAGLDEPYYAPGWAPERPRTDPLAIASLLTAVIGLGVVGIGLGIAALARQGRPGLRGRGLALAGIIVGSAWTVAVVVIAVSAALVHNGSGALDPDVTSARDANAIQLVAGNCLDPLPAHGDLTVVHVVPCRELHAAQVVSEFAFDPDTVWPGQAAANRRVALACEVSAAETAAGLAPVTWAPTARSWADGDRTGLCLLHRTDGTRVTGSLVTGSSPTT